MVFCNNAIDTGEASDGNVTILILIDGFLQLSIILEILKRQKRHNPYFNRWFSAIGGWKND